MKKILRQAQNKGFTLIELVMVLSIISIMASIAVPSYISMKQEGMYTKAQKEVTLVQAAVENYWREHKELPANISTELLNTKIKILTTQALDPWKTDGNNYGYKTGKTDSGEDYYVISSKGLAKEIDFEVQGNVILNKNDSILISNLPVIKE